MDLMELDIALKFCENKMETKLNTQRFIPDRKGADFARIGQDREIWLAMKNAIESEMEKIIIDKFSN